ncbi:hypothetical protein SKDZ_13G0360 [Saccharomyces kudriavzevii ZP591]|nr:hypothetical protein SKDZ_13G0360 [Saccharomyces kudriavzevii ZP591]
MHYYNGERWKNIKSGHIHTPSLTRNTYTYTRTRGTATHTRKMDGSTIVFVLIMMCLFMYTLKRKNAKEAPTRTVRNTKPAATAATKKPSPEPLPEGEPVPEPRVTQSDAHDVSRKRPVNNDMVEIVMTMAPHVPQQKVVQDLRSTGSIERTMENIFAGKLD